MKTSSVRRTDHLRKETWLFLFFYCVCIDHYTRLSLHHQIKLTLNIFTVPSFYLLKVEYLDKLFFHICKLVYQKIYGIFLNLTDHSNIRLDFFSDVHYCTSLCFLYDYFLHSFHCISEVIQCTALIDRANIIRCAYGLNLKRNKLSQVGRVSKLLT